MKRTIAPLLILSLTLSLCGCGSSKPDGMTKETYNVGKQALKVMDSYLAEKATAEKADAQLSGLMDELETEADTLSEKSNAGDVDAMSGAFYNSSVSFWISAFAMGMYGLKNSYGTAYDCQSARDSLYDALQSS